MLFNKYDKLKNLTVDKSEWIIRVRAQIVWKGINRQTQEFKGLNVIFIDDSNCRIHAFVSAKICDLFDATLKEGQIYTLSNFHVREYVGDENTRAIRFGKHIYFANHTKLKAESDNITKIAPYAFDLVDLHEVNKFIADTRFLIDVVGFIEDTNVKCANSGEDESKFHIRFKVTDGRTSVNVTFFNELAIMFEHNLRSISKEKVVIIIASAKVKEHEGFLCLNNYPATRFYLDVEHYSVPILQNRKIEPAVLNAASDLKEAVEIPLLTIAEIKKLPIEYKERKVRSQIIVKKVDEKTNWYYNVCTTCGEEVDKVDGRFKCLFCNRNIPYPDKRFRLATICQDSTGIIPIIFPDDEIQRILGLNAFDLDNDDDTDLDNAPYPAELKAFEKKEFIVTYVLSEKNLTKACNIYQGIEISDPVEVLGNHSPSKADDMKTTESPNVIDIKRTLHSVQSPPTGKSTNKIRTRASCINVPSDMDENAPISKYKQVKIEKVGNKL